MPLMTVEPDGVQVPVRAGETILKAMSNSGYGYRVGCRRGGCANCKVDLVSGEVVYTKPLDAKVLTEEEVAGGVCLSCRAAPVGDITIRLHDERIRLTNPLLRTYRMAQYEKDVRAQQEGPAAAS